MVNSEVNSAEKEARTLFSGARLRVHWLRAADGSLPGREDYTEKIDTLVQACLSVADEFLSDGHRIPPSRLGSFEYDGMKIWEFKAPQQRAPIIYRLLCHRVGDDFFAAVVFRKTSQEIPKKWKKLAAKRMKDSPDV